MMTWNLARADAQAWAARRGRVHAVLAREQPDVLCVQEAMPHQLADLREWLPRHHLVGGEPDARGERNAVLVLPSRYDVVGHGTEHLPGNGTPRAATWVRLRDRANGGTLTVVNVHFDHESKDARVAAAEKVRALFPGAILAGDMNAEPGSEVMAILQEGRIDPFPAVGAETMRGERGMGADAKYDHILLPPHVDHADARVVASDASDHHAIAVELRSEPRKVDADAAAEAEPTRSEGGTP